MTEVNNVSVVVDMIGPSVMSLVQRAHVDAGGDMELAAANLTGALAHLVHGSDIEVGSATEMLVGFCSHAADIALMKNEVTFKATATGEKYDA